MNSSEKCNCFEDFLEKAKPALKELIKGEFIEFNAGWVGHSFFFSGDHCPVNPKIEISYREFKRNGDQKQNFTKQQISILCSFCPMCGRKLAGSGVDAAQEDLPNDKTEPSVITG
ncbi:hypothetical protein [Shewanella glacialipiscicola]|uniref:hypothetical protein n=1 Tax=Shewanella glacialipiscicola TaxID=614069 RepID=UPI003D7BAEF7